MTDTPAAIDFLKQWEPNGPWVLTAIALDRKSIDTDTFDGDTLEDCEVWIDAFNGQRNLYFHVNPTIGKMQKKALREEIKSLSWLHVDVDPREGEDLDLERDRAYTKLMNPPKGVPKPTVIIFSGGGYQGFWKLEEPVPINGDLATAEELKCYNLQLELLFGGDDCHNVDRLMRLPGTINIPNAKKKAKGRTETLAKLEVFDHSRIYPISDFTKANPTQTSGMPSNSAKSVQISGNIPRVQSMDELDQWEVPDRVRVIIVQGRHPDEPAKEDDSRSSWLFDCVCQLVRASVPDETIYSIITDPDFAISESVLEQGRNVEKYAIRQIGKAKEFAINPKLASVNEKYAVIKRFGNKCRVVTEDMDEDLNRSSLVSISFADFQNAYMNDFVEIGTDKDGNPRKMPTGKWWLQHPERRQFERVVFAPNRETPGAYNLWRGYGCDAIPGNWELLHQHIVENVCTNDERRYRYLMGWMANMMQKPGVPGQVAVVMRGAQGTGKSFLANQLGLALGRHFLHVNNPSHLVGNFNSHLRDAVLVFADEAFYAGDKKHENALKMLITESRLTIEAKGVDVDVVRNCIHLIMASNKDWIIPANSRGERRFFVIDVSDEHARDREYFGRIANQMDNGGREAMLYDLLNLDLSDFDVRDVEQTDELVEQQIRSYDPMESWWYEKLRQGDIFPDDPKQVPWPPHVPTRELFRDYIEYCQTHSAERPEPPNTFGRFMHRVAGVDARQRPPSQGRIRFYVMKTVEQSRAAWEKEYAVQAWEDCREIDTPLEEETPF